MKLLKKGQIGGLQGFILSIVTVAIVLAVGLIVMAEMQGAAKVLGSSSPLNESVTLTSQIGSVSQNGPLFIGASAMRNSSMDSVAIGSGANITSTGAILTNATCCADDLIYVDYTHYDPSAAYNSSGEIITKMATIPTWIGIIIIVALAFIVLSFFIGKRQ